MFKLPTLKHTKLVRQVFLVFGINYGVSLLVQYLIRMYKKIKGLV